MTADLSGQDLGSYKLIEPLGAAGWPSVYRAYQATLNRFVAVKVFSPELLKVPGFADRFRGRMRWLARVRHPSILPLLDFGIDKDTSYCVMPWMPGGSLADRLKQGPLTLGQVAQVSRSLASALDYAHSQGILHDALKPQDVLFDQDDMPLLAGFEIAEGLPEESSKTGGVAQGGHLLYASPEEIGREDRDARSDIYSLGAVVYEAITGHRPFGDAGSAISPYKILTEPPRPLRQWRPDLPEVVEQAVLRALAKNPADRFDTAQAFVDAWARTSAEEIPSASRGAFPSMLDWARRWERRLAVEPEVSPTLPPAGQSGSEPLAPPPPPAWGAAEGAAGEGAAAGSAAEPSPPAVEMAPPVVEASPTTEVGAAPGVPDVRPLPPPAVLVPAVPGKPRPSDIWPPPTPASASRGPGSSPLESFGRLVGGLLVGGAPPAPAPRMAQASAADRRRSEAVVSTGFASPAQPDRPIGPGSALGCNQSYLFWLEVGAPVSGSMEKTPTPLPMDALPPDARLKVVLFGFDGELQIVPGADAGELQLLPGATARASRQPMSAEAVPVSKQLAKRLFFPVHTPERPGRFRLRCSIYYNQILVQSRLIHARVAQHPMEDRLSGISQDLWGWLRRILRRPSPKRDPALRSVVDYTLSHTLQAAHLTRLPAHQLSLMLNDNGDGTHGFRFVGAGDFTSNATLDSGTLQDLVRQARGSLRLAAWGDQEPWEQGKPYRYAEAAAPDQFKTDLTHLAIEGYRFYDALINRLAGGRDKSRELAGFMREPGRVQIALKEAANQLFPAALFYDYALDTGAPFDSYTLCPAFLNAVQAAAPLEEADCFKGHCPSRGQATVICPSGFWGYRHALGLPLSVEETPDAPAEVGYTGAPVFTVAVSTDPAFQLRRAHEQVLHSLVPGLGWHYAASRDQTLDLLKETSPHVVYFYCHGGLANNVPYLQVGPPNELGITRDNLRFKDVYWAAPRPLVFINGCHTTAVEPEQALELVSGFVGVAGAAGVIGTEITIFEPLARAFAEECLRRFVAGMEIGEAVRRARLALLKAGNPLGLVYIPFVLANLHLVKQPV